MWKIINQHPTGNQIRLHNGERTSPWVCRPFRWAVKVVVKGHMEWFKVGESTQCYCNEEKMCPTEREVLPDNDGDNLQDGLVQTLAEVDQSTSVGSHPAQHDSYSEHGQPQIRWLGKLQWLHLDARSSLQGAVSACLPRGLLRAK